MSSDQDRAAIDAVGSLDVTLLVNGPSRRLRLEPRVTLLDALREYAGLTEHTVYDRRTARPATVNLADYAVPVDADAPHIEAHFIDRPDPRINTLGCRGVGELSITGVAAAIANAVHHATGKRVRDLPITPDKLL